MKITIEENKNTSKPKCMVINDRYAVYADGVIYDREKAEDIPQWIFKMRDFFTEN